MANYTAASDRCRTPSVSPGRSDLVFASLSFLLNVRNTDPCSDTLVLALLHKFPLQKVQINLSLTGSLTHSVTAVNGWRSRLMYPCGRGPRTHLKLSWPWLAARIRTELFCVFLLAPLVITPQLAPLFCARRRLCTALLPHKRLIYFICDPIILGPSRKRNSHTDGYNDRWRLTGRDVCNYICCSRVPPNQCQAALEMSCGGSRAGWGHFLTVSIRKHL